MIVPDINLLVYAYDETARQHARAKAWWEECLSGSMTVGLPWVVLLGFVRLITSPKVFRNPMPVATATTHILLWLERANVQVLHPGGRHAEILCRFLSEIGTAGNLTTDAHLATLAVECRAVIYTSDTDFARFPGLRWINPLL